MVWSVIQNRGERVGQDAAITKNPSLLSTLRMDCSARASGLTVRLKKPSIRRRDGGAAKKANPAEGSGRTWRLFGLAWEVGVGEFCVVSGVGGIRSKIGCGAAVPTGSVLEVELGS